MSLLYISILWVCACVDSAESLVTVSAQVGSTVILPCKLTEEFKPTSVIKWQFNKVIVFERSSNVTYSGSGYEGRVDVPVHKLRKGNCSLVLKNVRFTDDHIYKAIRVDYVDNNRVKVINSVRLSFDALQISAPVGSTVILPCKLTEELKLTSLIRWQLNNDIVFERSSDGTYSGSGYEGRVDVPVDELRKGNCSLVLKNVRFTDDGFYKTFTMEHVDINTAELKEINIVTLSVYALQISAPVGSTVVLPCDWSHLSIKTTDVVWFIDTETVFERKGKDAYQGEGYEGRVDVPEDGLLKGNCSLVMKNISVTDTEIYSSYMLITDTQEPVLVQKVKLSVVENSVNERDSDSHQIGRNNWIILYVGIVIIIIIIINFVSVYYSRVNGLRCARNATEQNENVHRDTELHDIRARKSPMKNKESDLDSVTYTAVATQPQS